MKRKQQLISEYMLEREDPTDFWVAFKQAEKHAEQVLRKEGF